MAAAINTLGVVSGILGVVSFIQGNIPGSSPQGSTVQVKVGSAGVETEAYGGQIQRIDAFDAGNEYLGGSLNPFNVGRGSTAARTMNQGTPDIQTEYVSITAGDDNICLAWVVITQRDGQGAGFGWNGDVGERCNYPGIGFGMSDQVLGDAANGGGPHRPFCTYIQAGFPGATMKFNGAAYANPDNANDGAFCANTIFSDFNGPIAGQPGARVAASSVASDKTPIYKTERPVQMRRTLIHSSYSNHNATALCPRENFWSSDFIGVDDVYCDMETRTTYPLCSREDVEGCVVFDGHNVMIRSELADAAIPSGRGLSGGWNLLRDYDTFEDWTIEKAFEG